MVHKFPYTNYQVTYLFMNILSKITEIIGACTHKYIYNTYIENDELKGFQPL